ncbi:MAG: efflux RND transporter permease subunit [Firmicutes bacterium]|nr:efflux RND transporter permease subunit [Bacillota bacterium]
MFSKAAIKRPVTTVMIMLIVVLAGLISNFTLNLDLMPSMDFPVAIVSTTYVGAGPEEIETLITKPLEEALGTVTNVDSISSTSSANSSIVIVQFVEDTNIDLAAVDMREKVDMVKSSLPEGANEPIVLKLDINSMTAIYVGIKSETLNLTELNTLVEDTVVRNFEKIEGVTSVSNTGGIENEVQITIMPEKLHGYGLTTSQISQVLSSENMDLPAGTVQQGTVNIQIKSNGEFNDVDEIRELPITTNSGAVIHLSDVAEVEYVEKDRTSYALIDGSPAIMLVIQKQSDANIVDVSEKVNAEIAKVQREYPQIEFSMLSDTSEYIKTSVNNITTTALQAAVIAIVVIFVFLRNPKMSVIIGISIPTSIIATFAAMWLCGITKNMISMGGLAIGIGMLVDNSIVVLENIFSYMRKGLDPKEASERGAGEVAMAVMASTLTTVGVFIPFIFVSGTVGDVFKDLSLTICFSLFASLVVSVTFIPMACSKLLKPEQFTGEGVEGLKVRKKGILKAFLDAWGHGLEKLDNSYRRLLLWCLVNKKKVVAFVIVIFIATLSLVPRMGFDFMPEMDEGAVMISVSLPDGTILEETEAVVSQAVDTFKDDEIVETYYVMVGGGGVSLGGNGTNSGSIMLNLVDKEARSLSSKDYANQLETQLKMIPGCEITVSASSSAMGSYGGSGITMRITGEESDILRDISNTLSEMLEGIDGVTDISSSAEDTLPEVNIIANRAKASTYGLTAGQIASAVSGAVTGTVATQFKIDGTEVDVRIKQNDESVKYIKDILNLTVTTPTGMVLPLTEVADIVEDESAVSITRSNHHKYVDVNISTYGRDLGSIQKDVEARLNSYVFPEGYDYEFTGTLETMNESFQQLGLVLIVAVLLVYMIMASQFESFIYPFIVMFSMPLAITGGIFGLFVTGKSITTVSFMGFIMLVGMVVNNAIVLVDAANQNVAKGMSSYEAISTAGPDRLRPILMTTLTTVLGMIPLGIGLGEGMEMQQPMAIVIIFGLTISTLITLIFIPVLYMLVDKIRYRNIKAKAKKKFGKMQETNV